MRVPKPNRVRQEIPAVEYQAGNGAVAIWNRFCKPWVLIVALALPSLFVMAQTAKNCSESEQASRFRAGSEALQAGDLDSAERKFQSVLKCQPNAGAYANLGVVYMRKQNWTAATRALKQAARLAPGMTGVRLNLALVAFRQGKYEEAVPVLKTVWREEPNAIQPAYLLGLSYFFTQKYSEAAKTLHGLWPSLKNDLTYLYVLGLAADKSAQSSLSETAWTRLAEIGADTAQFHLLMGKAYYNRGDPDKAIPEFEAAEKLDPKLPFLHYNWGQACVFINQYERAREQFLKEIALDPEVPFSYGELGRVYDKLGDDAAAERSFQQALKLGPQAASYFGLAKIYERRGQLDQALKEVNAAMALDSESTNLHYLRARLLQSLGKQAEAKTEFAEAKRLLEKHRGEDTMERRLANPELSFQSE